MQSKAILLIVLFLSLFVGLASATEDEDIVDTIDALVDSIDALDIATTGNEILKRQLEDPTNESLLAENIEGITKKMVEPITGDFDNFDSKEFGNRMVNVLVFAIILEIFMVFVLPTIMVVLGGFGL